MEIFSYLQLTRRRLLVLVLVATVGAVVGGAIFSQKPLMYRDEAQVRVAQVFTPGRDPFETAGYNAPTLAALRSDAVLTAIAREANVSRSRVDAMQVDLPSDTAPIRLILEGDDRAEINRILTAAGRLAVRDTADEMLARAETDAKATESTLATRQAALDAFIRRTGYGYEMKDTLTLYEGTELPTLRQQLAASVDPTQQAALQARIDTLQAEVTKMRSLLGENQKIARGLDAAYAANVDAQAKLVQSRTQYTAAQRDDVVVVNEPTALSRVPTLAQGVVGGAAVGAAITAVGLFLTRRRRPASERVDAPAGAGASVAF